MRVATTIVPGRSVLSIPILWDYRKKRESQAREEVPASITLLSLRLVALPASQGLVSICGFLRGPNVLALFLCASLSLFRNGSRVSIYAVSLVLTVCQMLFARRYTVMISQEEMRPYSEAHYQLAMKAAGVGMWDWDMVCDKQFWNEECRTILGVPREDEASYRHFFSLVHPEDRAYVQHRLKESLHKRTKQNLEYRIIRPDGNVRWVAAKGEYLYNAQNIPVRMLGIIFDITARKQAEDATQAADRRMREILESVDEAFIHLDKDWHLTYVNSRAIDLIGKEIHCIPSKNLSDQTVWELCPVLAGTDAERSLHRVMETRQYLSFEFHYPTTQRWYDVHVYPAEDGGITSLITDITERYEFEHRKDEFIFMASHELRTPLTSLKGNLQLAEHCLKRILKEEEAFETTHTQCSLEHAILWIERALRQARIETRLINDILDASRIQADRLRIILEPNDLVRIVKDAVSDMRTLAPERTIRLMLPEHPTLPVMVDSIRIGQVITNYLTNALKYSAEYQPVTVGITLEQKEVRVWVKDSGTGLSPEAQIHIWDRFHRLSNFAEYEGLDIRGLGLGLYINQAIIQQHRGQVGVESTFGEGSTFWFTLPLLEK